jgi:diketogulonate reductase-like aldo/keto reductase
MQKFVQTLPSRTQGLTATTALRSGNQLPWLGFGVWQISGDAETERVVTDALAAGYRSIDTAKIYGNERGVGRAIRNSGIPREQIFVTTKLWNDDNRAGRVRAAFDHSLELLGFDYVDLYLVHWPVGNVAQTWKAMEKLLATGRVKAIGVSNHLRPHLDELLAVAEVVPAVNQIEFHPYLQSKPLVEFCHSKQIQPEAWSPLMVGGAILKDPKLVEIAQRHGKTVAQVILRWDLQSGVVTIPKTTHKERMIENSGVFDFALSDAEVATIGTLDRGTRNGPDPMHVSF